MALLCAFVPWCQTAPPWDVPSKQLLLDALERLKLLRCVWVPGVSREREGTKEGTASWGLESLPLAFLQDLALPTSPGRFPGHPGHDASLTLVFMSFSLACFPLALSACPAWVYFINLFLCLLSPTIQ